MRLLIALCAILLKYEAVSGETTQPAGCRGIARYDVVFQGQWSRQRFPKMYPMYRPPAQWSKVVGRTHNGDYRLFSIGSLASKGLQQLAEKGTSDILDQESQGSHGILDSFTAASILRGEGETSVTVFVDSNHTKMSLASKIVPSPDWFVGVDSLELCQDGEWGHSATVNLGPIDAGTDRGLTFTAPRWPTRPPKVIHKITSDYPSQEASSFFYPSAPRLPPMGQLAVRLVSWLDGEPSVFQTNHLIPGHMDIGGGGEKVLRVSPGTLSVDCNVTEWSAWSLCSKTCGFGQKSRQRAIVAPPENGGASCPLLRQEQLCGSMRNCRWRHFDFSRIGLKLNRLGSP